MRYKLKMSYVIYIQFVTALFVIEPDMALTWTWYGLDTALIRRKSIIVK